MFKEYDQYDATGLAELVAQREVAPIELLDAALRRAEAVDPRINAICVRFFELAQQRAREPLTGPYAGVPLLIKDAAQEYAGQPARRVRARCATGGPAAIPSWCSAGSRPAS